MTKSIPPHGDPGSVDLKISTVAMCLNLKNTESQGEYDLSAQETWGRFCSEWLHFSFLSRDT